MNQNLIEHISCHGAYTHFFMRPERCLSGPIEWLNGISYVTYVSLIRFVFFLRLSHFYDESLRSRSVLMHTHTHTNRSTENGRNSKSHKSSKDYCLWRNYWIWIARSNFQISLIFQRPSNDFRHLMAPNTCFFTRFYCDFQSLSITNKTEIHHIFFWNSIAKAEYSHHTHKGRYISLRQNVLLNTFSFPVWHTPILCASDSIPLHIIVFCFAKCVICGTRLCE